jgi:hypothetical protein
VNNTPNHSTGAQVPDLIKPEDVVQGGVGDCSFMAALMALATDNPQWVADHTAQSLDAAGNKVFSVQLRLDTSWLTHTFNEKTGNILSDGRRQAKVLLADGTYNYHEDAGDDTPVSDDGVEIWPQLYEKAWTQFSSGSGVTTDPATAWQALTGKGAQIVSTSGMSNLDIRDGIAAALQVSQKKQVCVGTFSYLAPSLKAYYANGGLVENHAYLVTGVDWDNGVVTLKNPWGEKDVRLLFSHLTAAISHVYILNSTKP